MLRRRLAGAALAMAVGLGGAVGSATAAEASGRCLNVSMSAQTSTRVTITNNCGNLAAVVNVRYKGNPYEYWTIVLNPLKSTTLTAAHPIKLGAWGLAAQP